MKLYGISGLGADKRVFKYLNLNSPLIPIEWITPEKKESIENYAARLSQFIDTTEKFGLIGVSFGGVIAVEISKTLSPEITILISSVETRQDLRLIYRIMGRSGLLKFVPKMFFVPPLRIANWIFGVKRKQLFKEIFDDIDLNFTKWAMNELVNWKNKERLSSPILKIVGTRDKLIPPQKVKNQVLIHKGEHFMIVDRADEISEIINEKITSRALPITNDILQNQAELHSAGAIIKHISPFHQLKSHRNPEETDQEFRRKWVIPFYMNLRRHDGPDIDKFSQLHHEITDEVVLKLLGEFDWRPRYTGAFFAAIKNKKEYTDIIGIHLLKSEVCVAGIEYSNTLGYFNTKKSIDYLERYLDYYLKHPELYFDQYAVIRALKYTDEVNSTNLLSRHMEAWKTFRDNQKQIEIENLRSLQQSDKFTEADKLKLSEIRIEEEVSYEIQTDWLRRRIESIQKIISGSKG